jgi:hypothetical protein
MKLIAISSPINEIDFIKRLIETHRGLIVRHAIKGQIVIEITTGSKIDNFMKQIRLHFGHRLGQICMIDNNIYNIDIYKLPLLNF